MRKPIQIQPKDWIRMMFCVKHLMKLHPEYNEMIMPFYSKMYDLYPYNEENPFDEQSIKTSIEHHLDELVNLNNEEKKTTKKEFNEFLNHLVVELGLNLPSWEDKDEEME